MSLLPTLFPAAILLFGIDYVQLGVLVSAGYLANVVAQPLAGRFSDVIEPRKLLSVGIGIMGVSCAVIAYAPNYSLLLVGAILLRVGSSFYHPIANSVVSRTTDAGKSADRRMGIQSAFGDLGSLVIFSGAALLYSILGWKTPFLLFAAVDLVFSFVVYYLLGNINSEIRRGIRNESKADPQQVVGIEEIENTLIGSATTELSQRKSGPYKLPVSFFFVASFIGAGAYAVILNFANSFLSHEFGSIVTADLLVSLWLAAFVAGDFACGELSKKVGRPRLILIAYGISAVLGIIFSIAVHNPIYATLALVGNGFALSLTFPLVYSELGSRTFNKIRERDLSSGMMFGLLFTSQVLGSAILAYAAGVLSNQTGLSTPFLVAGALLAVIAVAGSVLVSFGAAPK